MTDGKSTTPPALGGTPVTIHLTVTDVDEKFQQAVDAGATVVMPLEDQFWGDRYGMVRDPFGHQWSLGQPVREVSYDEIQQAMMQGPPVSAPQAGSSRAVTEGAGAAAAAATMSATAVNFARGLPSASPRRISAASIAASPPRR